MPAALGPQQAEEISLLRERVETIAQAQGARTPQPEQNNWDQILRAVEQVQAQTQRNSELHQAQMLDFATRMDLRMNEVERRNQALGQETLGAVQETLGAVPQLVTTMAMVAAQNCVRVMGKGTSQGPPTQGPPTGQATMTQGTVPVQIPGATQVQDPHSSSMPPPVSLCHSILKPCDQACRARAPAWTMGRGTSPQDQPTRVTTTPHNPGRPVPNPLTSVPGHRTLSGGRMRPARVGWSWRGGPATRQGVCKLRGGAEGMPRALWAWEPVASPTLGAMEVRPTRLQPSIPVGTPKAKQ